jgi:large subunit ribosomal protein L13e
MVRMIAPRVISNGRAREAKGFSLEELRKHNLNPGEARHLGIPVDPRRRTLYKENVEAIEDWLEEAKNSELRFPKPKKKVNIQRGRAYRGLTSSGKKMRGLKKPR